MSLPVLWSPIAWEDYVYWQTKDRALLKRINALVKDIQRSPFEGIGKPEQLRHSDGYWSRRIDQEHRIVYRLRNGVVEISSARFHYAK